MKLAHHIGEVVLVLYVLWLLFVLCMAFLAAWPKLPVTAKVLAVPPVVVSRVFDVVFNWTVAIVLFAQLPPTGTYTFVQRLSLYKKEVGWRATLAKFICTYFIDVFQTGGCA